MNLEDVILRGLAAARPLATDVPSGTLYYSTDIFTTDRSNGATWQTYTDGGTSGGGSSVQGFILGLDGVDGEQGEQGIPGPPATLNLAQKIRQIGITVDGGGSAISTGVKGYKSFPVAGVIIGVRLLADQVGSAVVDIWKDTFANYPPTVADTITAAAKPTLSTNDASEDTTLSGWTTAVAAGDVFGFNVDSATTITRLTLELTIVVLN